MSPVAANAMEEAAEPEVPAPVTPSKDDADTDAAVSRFLGFCKSKLGLAEGNCVQSSTLLRKTAHVLRSSGTVIGTGTAEEAERYWFAFVLYTVRRVGERKAEDEQNGSDETEVPLSRILKASVLNLIDFFKEIPQFVIKAGAIVSGIYGANWDSRLEAREMQTNYVHLCILCKFYKRICGEFFILNDAKDDMKSADSSTSDPVIMYQPFGWLLFLALRIHALSRFKDLVSSTNALVSVLAILIIHLPTRFRKFSISDSSQLVKRSEKGVDLVGSLAYRYDTSEDEIKRTLEKANNVIAEILGITPPPASECKAENLENVDTDGLIYFGNLMEETSLSSILSTLEKIYEDATRNDSEFDERVFINDDDSLLVSGSLSGAAINLTGAKRKYDSFASPAKTITRPLSPSRSPASHINGIIGGTNLRITATPVATAMTTAKWLRTFVSPLPSKPSTDLQGFLASCDRDVTSDVIRRANIILEAIFPNSPIGERTVTGGLQNANLMDNMWAEQRRLEALKLYYRVLEAMCRAEAQILHSNNLTSLLTNERFHRCMLACSAELVLATHKTVTMLFPAVLERTGITAFDLSKVIESFVRHEETLPRELRRHLNTLEERLLENMVWERGSSMYNSLVVARPALAPEINRLGLLPEPMPSLDAIALLINFSSSGLPQSPVQKHEASPGQNGDIRSPKRISTEYRSVLVERNFTSPVKDRLLALSNIKSKLPPPPLQSAFASPTRPHPGGGGETCAETAIHIFFSKITKLAAVRINAMLERLQLSQQIKEGVYCLFQQILSQRTNLFFNRHIDQVILCCFYGVAKINQINLTFREIIYNYRKQPQCKPQVFRNVFVDWSTRRNGKAGNEHVDIISFYNEIFIPSVKPLLVELGPTGATTRTNRTSEVGNKNDAQCPGSPKISSFPTLPDMSPKKVSASHNVYVSPLRSSKMDASISHSLKSYYACVGESTHAYQSPSKDLVAINSRLNGNRKVRGTLNFDDVDAGLVSDSMVANSLYLQNGSSMSSSTAKSSEKPES